MQKAVRSVRHKLDGIRENHISKNGGLACVKSNHLASNCLEKCIQGNYQAVL